MSETADFHLTGPLLASIITASSAIVLWVLNNIIVAGANFVRRYQERERFVRALFAEIDFNTTDLKFFLSRPISYDAFRKRIEESNEFIPHITDARHTHIYMSNINSINSAGKNYISDVVYFYGLLEKIKVKIEGIYLKSYTNISVKGRENVIRGIYRDARETVRVGEEILEIMQLKYSRFQMKRKDRADYFDESENEETEKISDAALKERFDRFKLEFDRVRANHAKTSYVS